MEIFVCLDCGYLRCTWFSTKTPWNLISFFIESVLSSLKFLILRYIYWINFDKVIYVIYFHFLWYLGEGYITVEGNEGDRNNLNLWHSGDALVSTNYWFSFFFKLTLSGPKKCYTNFLDFFPFIIIFLSFFSIFSFLFHFFLLHKKNYKNGTNFMIIKKKYIIFCFEKNYVGKIRVNKSKKRKCYTNERKGLIMNSLFSNNFFVMKNKNARNRRHS